MSLFLPSQTEYARFENGRYVFRIHRSPLCEYMINFIHKLKHLPEKYMMNSVLENFTILQVNSSKKDKSSLCCASFLKETVGSGKGKYSTRGIYCRAVRNSSTSSITNPFSNLWHLTLLGREGRIESDGNEAITPATVCS